MDRTVPRTGSEEIELYIRTYYSLLRSTTDVQIRSLEEVHGAMGSSLHPTARSPNLDLTAFIYTSLRLPPCIAEVQRVILGQTEEVFRLGGLGDVTAWQPVTAKARRRRSYFDGQGTLACFIASGSDIDDIIPMLTAYQIEWNKLHRIAKGEQVRRFLKEADESEEGLATLASGLGVDVEGLENLRQVWKERFWATLRWVAEAPRSFRVRLLAGSLNDYRRATQVWFETVEQAFPELPRRPVYFVSSNSHSIANLISGFALRRQAELVRFLHTPEHDGLLSEWREIDESQASSGRENLLYYVLKKYLDSPDGIELERERLAEEVESGILRVPAGDSFDIEAQIIEMSRIRAEQVDPRLRRPDLGLLSRSEALILNIDYPLGLAAYLILSHLATRAGSIRGVYVMGKAATLNGVIGDVMIPSVVHDEQSQNTYLFENGFNAERAGNHLTYGTVLDNQKAVTVRGTFLQTPRYMDVFYREGYTDIEMEAGPYLSAVYEMYRPKRHPNNEIVNLYGLPFDVGILHYASDTPLGKGLNLGAGSLSYAGMDPTYASSLAILQRIIDLEIKQITR